jgi:transposase-like protein
MKKMPINKYSYKIVPVMGKTPRVEQLTATRIVAVELIYCERCKEFHQVDKVFPVDADTFFQMVCPDCGADWKDLHPVRQID